VARAGVRQTEPGPRVEIRGQLAVIPEPGTLGLTLLGAAGRALAGPGRKRRRYGAPAGRGPG
jgi:hypothetical protein